MRDAPHVLVVMFDQLRHDVVADPALCDTPSLDRLRGEATWFDQHYTPTGLCSPARASLMTGFYPHTHGVLNNVHGWAALVHDLPEDRPTVAELLRSAGYRTGHVGKWHLGAARGPAQAGFDDVRCPEAEDDPSVAVALEDYVGSMVFTRPRHGDGLRFPMYLRDAVPAALVPASAVFDQALDLLESYADGDQPFFLVVSFPEPHHPAILPAPFVDRYDPSRLEPWASFSDTFENKPRTNDAGLRHYGVADFTWEDWAPFVARYLGAVSMLDDLVGRLMLELERSGRAADTAVIVTADHGDMTGSHRQFNKGPFMYEDLYRVPLLVRAPFIGTSGGGRRVGALTSHVDLLPTIAELGGMPVPPRSWDGTSLVPWLSGTEPQWRTALQCEFHGDEFGLYSQRMLRRADHKLVYNPNDVDELYDLAADPHELRNLAFDHRSGALRVELERELLELMRQSRDGLAEFAEMMLG